jgi:hypothetical protein
MSTVEKFKELFSANRRLIKRLLKTIEYSKSNDILADIIIEKRGQTIKKLNKDIDYIAKDNDELRNTNLGYESGNKDPSMVLTQVSDYKSHNENNATKTVSTPFGRKTTQVKSYEWKRPVVADELDIPDVPLNDILFLCESVTQKNVASYFYDQELECHGSFQKTANALGESRQYIYYHVKAIEKIIKEKIV